MADNFDFTPGTGKTGSAEDEGGVLYPNVKLTASGTGTTEALSKAEDSGHTSGNHGIMALTVRQDTAAALSGTDADYQPLITDASGRLHVLDQNSANILTALQIIDDWDDSDKCNVNINVAGTDVAANAGVLNAQTLRVTIATDDECNNYLGTIDADTGNMVTALQLLDNAVDGNYLNVNLNVAGTDAAAGEGVISAQTQRVTIATDDDGVAHLATLAGAVAATHMQCDIVAGTVTTVSTVTNLAQMGGTAIAMNEGVLAAGVQRVTLATDDDGVAHLATIAGDTTNIETAIQIIDDWDATHASAAPADGVQVMGAAYSAGLPTDVGADADAARIMTDRFGRIVRGLMPQNFQATMTSADAQAATPVKVKTASRKMYILSLVASTDTALNLQFQDDTGPTVLIEGIYLAANGGFVMNWPPEAPLVVNTNEDFDVIASAAGNISVTITGYLAV